jgi:hypothetical protein
MKNPDDSTLENKVVGEAKADPETVTARYTDPKGTFTGQGHDGYDQDGFDYDYIRAIPGPADSDRMPNPRVKHKEHFTDDAKEQRHTS